MTESDLAEIAVKAVVGEVTKGGVSTLLGWLRGKLTSAAGHEAADDIAKQPDDPSAQLALQAQVLKLLKTPEFAAELRAHFAQPAASTTTYAAQAATRNSGPVNQVQGSGNSTSNR